MAPHLSATAAAALAGQVVRGALLVFFDFASSPMLVWQGFGTLHTQDGRDWQGIGDLGSIDGLESALAGTAPVTTFSVSGVNPALIADTLNSASEVKGRDVTVFLQFFDDSLQTLDSPYAIYLGTMDVMRIKAQGPTSRVVEVTAETLFARRGFAPFGYLSNEDQNRLFPGDRGLEQMVTMQSKSVTWPPVILPG